MPPSDLSCTELVKQMCIDMHEQRIISTFSDNELTLLHSTVIVSSDIQHFMRKNLISIAENEWIDQYTNDIGKTLTGYTNIYTSIGWYGQYTFCRWLLFISYYRLAIVVLLNIAS